MAKAGEDKTIVLPVNVIRLDGSKSTHDGGSLSYSWVRSDESPGAGDIVNGTNNQPVLLLTNPVAGIYIFTLTVKDGNGLKSSDSVTIHVEQSKSSVTSIS